jgi:hypothetical protein
MCDVVLQHLSAVWIFLSESSATAHCLLNADSCFCSASRAMSAVTWMHAKMQCPLTGYTCFIQHDYYLCPVLYSTFTEWKLRRLLLAGSILCTSDALIACKLLRASTRPNILCMLQIVLCIRSRRAVILPPLPRTRPTWRLSLSADVWQPRLLERQVPHTEVENL